MSILNSPNYFYNLNQAKKIKSPRNSQLSLSVEDIDVTVTWKSVKNIRLRVSPPDGKVKVSSPKGISQQTIKNFIRHQLDWIKKHQLRFNQQIKVPENNFESGEIHWFYGKPLRLQVILRKSCQQVEFNDNNLTLYVKEKSTKVQREKLLYEAYRTEIKKLIPDLIQQWEVIIGKKVEGWAIRKMKARWGSCNISTKKILLNLELAKKTPQCIEYVLVHEIVHLLERYHNRRFYQLMDHFLPNWKVLREQLNLKNES